MGVNRENSKSVKVSIGGEGLCDEESIKLMVTSSWQLFCDNQRSVLIVKISFGELMCKLWWKMCFFFMIMFKTFSLTITRCGTSNEHILVLNCLFIFLLIVNHGLEKCELHVYAEKNLDSCTLDNLKMTKFPWWLWRLK